MCNTTEKAELRMLNTKHEDIARRTAAVFNQNHPEKSIDLCYVSKLVQKFMETGSVQNRKLQLKLTKLEFRGR